MPFLRTLSAGIIIPTPPYEFHGLYALSDFDQGIFRRRAHFRLEILRVYWSVNFLAHLLPYPSHTGAHLGETVTTGRLPSVSEID